MDVSRIPSQSSAGAATGTTSGNSTGSSGAASDADGALMGLGKSDFMKLLVAQLRNQDPFKPMEDKEFITQIAQLNSLEQISALNEKMVSFINLEAMGQASALIGKAVEAGPDGPDAIKGVVQEVRIEQGKLVLMVGDHKLSLTDIRKITPAA